VLREATDPVILPGTVLATDPGRFAQWVVSLEDRIHRFREETSQGSKPPSPRRRDASSEASARSARAAKRVKRSAVCRR